MNGQYYGDERLFVKVLELCLLIKDMSVSLKILNNISVIISKTKYGTNTSVSVLSRACLW